jgi:hypothetical protein
VLVDGKSLALNMIATCNFIENGWCSDASDVKALSDYVHKCKLGRRLRPDRAMALVKEMTQSHADRDRAGQELKRMISLAKSELKKIQAIQEQRLLSLYQELSDAQVANGD